MSFDKNGIERRLLKVGTSRWCEDLVANSAGKQFLQEGVIGPIKEKLLRLLHNINSKVGLTDGSTEELMQDIQEICGDRREKYLAILETVFPVAKNLALNFSDPCFVPEVFSSSERETVQIGDTDFDICVVLTREGRKKKIGIVARDGRRYLETFEIGGWDELERPIGSELNLKKHLPMLEHIYERTSFQNKPE